MTAVALEASNTFEKLAMAAIVGKMCKESARMLAVHARFAGTRVIDMLFDDLLPRTC